jgi:hypothetical protein
MSKTPPSPFFSNKDLVWRFGIRHGGQNKVTIQFAYVPYVRISQFLEGERGDITRLAVHEPGMHKVVYNDNASIFETINSEQNQKTMFTEYFQANIDYPLARKVTYMDFPFVFTWTNGTKKWTMR